MFDCRSLANSTTLTKFQILNEYHSFLAILKVLINSRYPKMKTGPKLTLPIFELSILHYFINQIGALPTHSLLQPMKQAWFQREHMEHIALSSS